ncbi:ABC transporter substrate-binding protein [Radiobacillus deserti]|uniref:SgrR family transcriptional regulator n=1 Tax=Radiobacillus deserti TaxID=2594883 RepID=A0A516KEM9_9BACI|nr:ABC transporter substrate-binding protein [Radiobacillus deserti]QDP39862.1 hypothetical protein FN924_06590 [Radiobacillus deserti]
MKPLDYYEHLYAHIQQTNKEIPIPIEQLASLFICSRRNVKLILNKFQDNGWITWKHGIGRGNVSHIILNFTFHQLVLSEAKQMAHTHPIDICMAFIRKKSVPVEIQKEYVTWIFSDDLYHTEQERDRIQFPSYRALQTLDPVYVNRRTENHFMRHMYQQLVKFDKNNGVHVPSIAHYWEHNGTYTIWRFHLRKGIMFHNHSELTAEDVAFSFQRLSHLNSPYKWMIKYLERIQVDSIHQVSFYFLEPTPFFLHVVSSLGGSILTPSENESSSIGTGPFKLSKLNDEKLKLSIHNRYSGYRPFLDEVVMFFFPELYDNKYASEHMLEHADLFPYPYVQKQKDDYQQKTMIDRGSKLLTFNRKQGLLAKDEKLRKALYHALSPEKMISTLKGNRYVPAFRLLREWESEITNQRHKSLSKTALEESTYQGETLHLYTYSGAGNELDAQWIKTELETLEVCLCIHVLSYDSLFSTDLAKEADLLLAEQLGDENLIYSCLGTFLGNHSIWSFHLPTKVMEEIEKQLQTNRTTNELLQSLQKVEETLFHEYSFSCLYRLQQYAIFPAHVKHIKLNALGWVDYSSLWIT